MNRLLKFASVASALTRISFAQAENEISGGDPVANTVTTEIDPVGGDGLVLDSSTNDTGNSTAEDDENRVTSETDPNILNPDNNTNTTNTEEDDIEIPLCTGEEEEGVVCVCTGEEEKDGAECVEPEPVLPEDLTIG